jgi:hypothetical protein
MLSGTNDCLLPVIQREPGTFPDTSFPVSFQSEFLASLNLSFELEKNGILYNTGVIGS